MDKIKSIRTLLFTGVFIITLLPHFLSAQSPTGHLRFEFTNTDSAYVLPGNDLFNAVNLASGDSLELNPGVHLFSLQTHFDKSETLYLQVFSDSTVTYSYSFKEKNLSPVTINNNIAARNYYDSNVFVLTDEDSEIFFNGEYQGTGFAKFNTFGELGELEIKNPDFGRTKRRLNVPEQRVNFIRRDLRPVKSITRFYSIFPGVSQLYKKQHLKASLFGISAVSLFTYAGIKYSKYHNELDIFYEYQEDYNNATTEQEALRLGDITESQHNKVQRLDNQRKFSLIAGLLIYAYNIYDAFTSHPDGGYRTKRKPFEFYLSSENSQFGLVNSGTMKINF